MPTALPGTACAPSRVVRGADYGVVFQDILVACGLSDAVSGLVRRRCLRDRFCADHNCLVLPVLYTFVFVFVPVAVSPCLCTGDNRDRDSLLQTLLCVGSHAT